MSSPPPAATAPSDPGDDTAGPEPRSVAAQVAAARTAQRSWKNEPVAVRIEALQAVKQRILARAEEIAAIVSEEVGKPIEEAVLAEVLPNADLVSYWCEVIEEALEAAPIELDPLAYPGKRGRTFREPRGVIALITPWNYPVAIPLRTLVPALLAGNAVAFKPSEVTPRSGALVASLFDGLLPDGLFALIEGDGAAGRELLETEVDACVFTGSVATGKAVARAAAERLIPCSLELGGKDAAIVLADCRLERAAHGVAWGAFTNAGQNCAAIERVYVEEKIADAFIERLVAITKTLVGGRDVGRMATAAQRDVVVRHLDDARANGAELLTGDAEDDADPLYIPPTVLRADDHEEARFMRDETFGPLLPVVVVPDAASAVERVNASRFALTTSIWTKNIRRANELANDLRSGVVTINNHAFTGAVPAAPWTGAGETGYGVTNSLYALGALTRVRFVLEDRNRAARELWWYPYTPVLRQIAFSMAKLRGGANIFGRLAALFTLLVALPKRLFER